MSITTIIPINLNDEFPRSVMLDGVVIVENIYYKKRNGTIFLARQLFYSNTEHQEFIGSIYLLNGKFSACYEGKIQSFDRYMQALEFILPLKTYIRHYSSIGE